MSSTLYCYHCRVQHSPEEMRLIVSKTGKRWRCIKSIEATRKGREAREAYGRQVSASNKAEAQAKLRMRPSPEEFPSSS